MRRNNPAVASQREKAVPAQFATVGWKAEQPVEPGKAAHPVFARNVLYVHVPAQPAMREPDKFNGHGPGVESQVTGLAAPWTQSYETGQMVLQIAPMRAPRTIS
jgi:hypothetical protein